MKKHILYSLTVAALLNASVGFAMIQQSQEFVVKAFYGTKDFCVDNCSKGLGALDTVGRKVPGGNAVLDNLKLSLVTASAVYALGEYAYYKKTGNHTRVYNGLTNNCVSNFFSNTFTNSLSWLQSNCACSKKTVEVKGEEIIAPIVEKTAAQKPVNGDQKLDTAKNDDQK